MNLEFELEPHDALTVRLRDGHDATTVSVPNARAGIDSLARTLGQAIANGYGECFWPSLDGGHYWWMLKTDQGTLEVVLMWSRGGASGWQHVFRVTDAASWVHDRVTAEAERIGLGLPSA